MSATDPSPSRDVLERARAYVRVDERVVAAMPELREAIRSFQPAPGPAGESVAEWLMERALSMPQEATLPRLRAARAGQSPAAPAVAQPSIVVRAFGFKFSSELRAAFIQLTHTRITA